MVTIEGTIGWDDLEQRLRETTLLQPRDGEAVYPYANADIRLAEIPYAEVAPTSLYVLRGNLATQATIAKDIAGEGYDPLQLTGGLLLKNDAGEHVGLVPPIVEETADVGKYILDGAHRTSIGRWLGRTHFMGILISGIRPDCPAYAYPNTWDEIHIMEAVPKDPAQKKHYRDNYRPLYRDFSRLNGSSLRES
jgi:hypothetical protein